MAMRPQLHGDAAELRAGHPVLGAGQLLDALDRRLVLPLEAQLDAAQLGVGEQELDPVLLTQRIAQDPLARGVIEEIVLGGPAREHVGVVEHVEVGRAAGRILGRGRIDVDDALLGLLHAVELAADLVVADELDADGPVGPLLDVVDELQAAGALDQQVALVESGGAELQLVLGLAGETLVVGRIRGLGQTRQGDRPGQGACGQEGRGPAVLAGHAEQVPT
jgi:hypothetical protein